MFYTLVGKLYPGKNIIDFTRASLKAGKNNFYINADFTIKNLGPPQMGHGYGIRVSSKGYKHRSQMEIRFAPFWKAADYGVVSKKYTIDWERDYDRMLRDLDSVKGAIKSVGEMLGRKVFVNVDVNKFISGEPPTRFDDEPTGFIS